jgi:hypothetical protein
MDSAFYGIASGRALKCLAIVDDATREAVVGHAQIYHRRRSPHTDPRQHMLAARQAYGHSNRQRAGRRQLLLPANLIVAGQMGLGSSAKAMLLGAS